MQKKMDAVLEDGERDRAPPPAGASPSLMAHDDDVDDKPDAHALEKRDAVRVLGPASPCSATTATCARSSHRRFCRTARSTE